MIWLEGSVWLKAAFFAVALMVLIFGVLAFERRNRCAGYRFPAEQRLKDLPKGWRAKLLHLPLIVRGLALLLMLFAATRPQWAQEETAEVEGIDIVVALDLSGSMRATDISDEDLVALLNRGESPKSRFESAIDTLRTFIQSRRYDRVGLVVFGKNAFLQFPLTLDYGVMLRILDQMELGDIDGSATAIGNALTMAENRLAESDAKTKLIILVTDGEDNGSNVSPVEVAQYSAKENIPIFPILVGSEDQSREPTGMKDAFTGQPIYQKVINPVNPALLEQIAEITNGKFYRASDEQSLQKDFHDILDQYEKSRLVDYASADRTELYPYFLLPALALLLLELLLSQVVLRRFP